MRLNKIIWALGSICRWEDLRIKPQGILRVRGLADEKSAKERDGMGREEGGGFRMGNTCIPVADSF